MPRVIEEGRCPHCGIEVARPAPRACPACGGSLQLRYLRAGCLSSAPPLLVLLLGLGWVLQRLLG